MFEGDITLGEIIILDHRDMVSTITLNQQPRNSITPDLLEDLRKVFDTLEKREKTRCVVLTGSGTETFSSGADMSQSVQFSTSEARDYRDAGRSMLERMETFPKPIVAAVRGRCAASGAALAWVCDIRLASESAVFNAGDIYGGTSPSWSTGMVRLVHYIGRNRTLDIMLLGEDISAVEAFHLGIVSRVTPDDLFEAEITRVSDRLASAAPLAVRALKEAVRAQWRDTPDRAAVIEEQSIQRILQSRDAKEGMKAEIEHRQPVFEGR